MDAAFGVGLDALEITMNTPGVIEMLKKNRSRVPDGKYLGTGTVCTRDEAERAADAGAMFFVTPIVDTFVIALARSRKIPVIAGAFTPTEIFSAWNAGASMVKVFPCNPLGPGYIRDLKGPFNAIPLVAVGGVTVENAPDYFHAGVQAVGVGDALFGKKALERRCIREIADNVRTFLNACPPTSADLRQG